jgi:Flp pilus assembly protein TadG
VGQGLVELALVLPVLLLITMGVVDFGRVFQTYVAVVNAARDGARYCALHPGDAAGTLAQVQKELGWLGSNVTVSGCSTSLTAGAKATVAVNTTVDLLTPLLLKMSNPYPIGAHAAMVVWG